MNILRWKLHWQVMLSLCFAISIGLLCQSEILGAANHWILEGSHTIGRLFLNMLKMIVVPVIVTSIIVGMLDLGAEDGRGSGRIGLKVFFYYTLTGVLAILTGLILVNWFEPGVVEPALAESILGLKNTSVAFQDKLAARETITVMDVFYRLFPTNIFSAASDNGQLLGLITFSLLFGFFASRLPQSMRSFQVNLWKSLHEVIMALTQWVIRFSPIGILGLVIPIVAKTGWEVVAPLTQFVLVVLLALAIHLFLNLSCLLWGLGRINPLTHLKSMLSVLLTAFSTASSASTLPLTMRTVKEEAGVSNRVSSFTLPLGATVNMDGTALYECVVVVFIAQFYGVVEGFTLAWTDQLSIVVLALATSVGVAGIPAASLVAITVILSALGLPVEAVGLIWVTDRILDMCRTAVNVYSDTCGAVIIARSEGDMVYNARAT